MDSRKAERNKTGVQEVWDRAKYILTGKMYQKKTVDG